MKESEFEKSWREAAESTRKSPHREEIIKRLHKALREMHVKGY